ncbi:MAG: hypothetical protein ACR2F2_13745 [Pyrinomonadaceae bacterium]
MNKDFTKRMINRFLILIFALFLGFGGMTACSQSDLKSNNSAKAENVQSESIANNKPTAEKKAIENKNSDDAEQPKKIEVFDGRNNDNQKSGDKETPFVREIVRAKQTAIQSIFKDSEFECSDTDVRVEGLAEGSFTKPKSSQVAYLYRTCMSDAVKYPSFVSGLIITESEEVVAHFVYADVFGGFTNLKILPDINRNGLSEIVLRSSLGYGYYTDSIDIYEFGANNPVSLGGTKILTNSPDDGEEDHSETAYAITAQADKSPVFFRETYRRKSDPEKWLLQAKESIFSLEKKNTPAQSGFKLLKK